VCRCKAIYLFDVYHVTLSKILEIIGLALIGGTIYSFIGMTESELRWPVFWSCAGGALAIIVYRNYMRRRRKKYVDVTSQNNKQNYTSADLLRSILG